MTAIEANRQGTARWRPTRLGAVTSWMSGGTPSKDNPEFWGGMIPWLSAKSLTSFYLYNSDDRVTEAAIEAGARLALPGDVLLLVRGMTLHNDVPVGIAMRPMTFNQDVKGIRGTNGADLRFIAYWLLGHKADLLAAVDQASHGTGRLQTDLLHAMEMRLPPENEQPAIAGVLGALDDKIEQNRRTAQALEGLARAIFRAWFVDFEPVKTKAAGATSFPSMPQPVFDALLTRFVESEIGPVPEGCAVKKFSDVLTLPYGKALKADQRRSGSIPVYGSNGQVGWHDKALAKGPGIVVGRKGNPGTVEWCQSDFFQLTRPSTSTSRTNGSTCICFTTNYSLPIWLGCQRILLSPESIVI